MYNFKFDNILEIVMCRLCIVVVIMLIYSCIVIIGNIYDYYNDNDLRNQCGKLSLH